MFESCRDRQPDRPKDRSFSGLFILSSFIRGANQAARVIPCLAKKTKHFDECRRHAASGRSRCRAATARRRSRIEHGRQTAPVQVPYRCWKNKFGLDDGNTANAACLVGGVNDRSRTEESVSAGVTVKV
jgi:hypothetical protein